MAKGNFEAANARTLVYEGGFSNNPKDPGGRTMEGVTQRVYNAYRKVKGLPLVKLSKAMKGQPDWIKERDEIYLKQYWASIKGDDLPAGVDFFMYDMSVNMGAGRAVKILQASLNEIAKAGLRVDGKVGVNTLAALTKLGDTAELIGDMSKRRQGFYEHLSTFSTFGDGWTTRNRDSRKIALAWAAGAEGALPNAEVVAMDGHKKAPEEAVKKTDATTEQTGVVTGTATGGVIGLVGLKALLDQLSDALAPFKDTIEVVSYALLAIAVLSALYGIWTSLQSIKGRHALNGQAKSDTAVDPDEDDYTATSDTADTEQEYVPAIQSVGSV